MSKRANQKRALRIKKVLHNYADEADDLRANITDALTDLRHLCDVENLDLGSSQGAQGEVYTLHSPLDAIQQR